MLKQKTKPKTATRTRLIIRIAKIFGAGSIGYIVYKFWKSDKFFAWVTGEVFTTGILAFTFDLGKAFLLGLVGGLGGLLAKYLWSKIDG